MTRLFVSRGVTAIVISLLVNVSVAEALAIDRATVVVAPAKPAPPSALSPASETTAVAVATNVRVRMARLPVSDASTLCRSVTRSQASGADMAISSDDPRGAGEFGQAHRPARVQLLGRDADLRAEPELLAVGEPGRRVDHHGRGVAPHDERRRGG